MKRFIAAFCAIVVLTISGFAVFHPEEARANWNANNVISDSVFDNSGTMSAGDIQNFLNQFPNSCLKSYAAPYPNGYNSYGGNVSAATVIRRAADIYGVNPQVIIATLQKESSVVTSDCTYINTAMGMGCPDSGGCSPEYQGFSQQVTKGTWLLKFGKERSNGNAGWNANDGVGGDSNLSYSGPMTEGCKKRSLSSPTVCYDGLWPIDGQTVHIDTGTTGSFYNYTPHFHGNQLFVSIFEGWFGSVHGAQYEWQWLGQTANADLNNLTPGQVVTLNVSAKNTGTKTWTNSGPNQINIGTSRPNGRTSEFSNNSWISSNTPARLNEASVGPGQTGTFTFTITVPIYQGTFDEYFNLVAQGITWFNDLGLSFRFNIPSDYQWSWNSQAAYTDSSKSTPVNLNNMSPGQTAWLVMKANNTGPATWYNTGNRIITLATENEPGRASRFATPDWYIGNNTPAKLSETSVAPGQVGTFEFPITIPQGGGNYVEFFNLITQNVGWFNRDVRQYFQINVNQDYRWSFNSEAYYTDSNKGTALNRGNLSPGQTAWLVVKANNVGQTTWYKDGTNQVNLATDRAAGRASRFATGAWLLNNTPAKLSETSVAPGQVGTFEFPIKIPAGAGAFKEYFNPVAQHITFFNSNVGQNFNLNVNHDYRWSWDSQAAYTDSNKSTPVNLSAMSAGQTAWLVVKANNVGQTTWYKDGTNQVNLATDRAAGRASRFATGAWLLNNTPAKLSETSVAPGQVGTFEFPIKIPAGAGAFKEYFNPVAQHITFFNSNVGQYFEITVP